MKNKTFPFLVLTALLLLFGCQSGPKISSEFNPDTDFSGYSKYVMLPLPASIPGGDPGMVLRTGKIIEQAAIDSLAAKGFQQVEAAEADFAVKLTGKVVPKVDVTDMGYTAMPRRGWYGYYQPFYYESNVYVDQYEEGTLIIEVYDAASRELVWVGWGEARKRSGPPDTERINAAVDSILAGFPPSAQM
jgi:hypothetical protein